MIKESVKEELAGKLERLLNHLNFSEIQVQKHTEHPDPEIHHNILETKDYTPSLVAKKK